MGLFEPVLVGVLLPPLLEVVAEPDARRLRRRLLPRVGLRVGLRQRGRRRRRRRGRRGRDAQPILLRQLLLLAPRHLLLGGGRLLLLLLLLPLLLLDLQDLHVVAESDAGLRPLLVAVPVLGVVLPHLEERVSPAPAGPRLTGTGATAAAAGGAAHCVREGGEGGRGVGTKKD